MPIYRDSNFKFERILSKFFKASNQNAEALVSFDYIYADLEQLKIAMMAAVMDHCISVRTQLEKRIKKMTKIVEIFGTKCIQVDTKSKYKEKFDKDITKAYMSI